MWKRQTVETLKYLGRFALQIPSIYIPTGKPHVFLFSTRRSGSTLLRDIIYSQPGFNYIDQPFDIWQFNPHKRLLPKVEQGQFISLNEADQKKLINYTHKILQRNYIFRSQWQLWRRNYHWRWERYVVKILSAKALMPWFQDTFKSEIKIIYMTRHPIPTALSIMKRKWGLTAKAYLENESFVQMYLSDKLLHIGWDILQSGSLLEKHVLNWCLENLVPLHNWETSDWVTISYEKLILEPVETTERLCQKLDLSEVEKMIDVIEKPTRTTVKSSKEAILSAGSKTRLDAWRKHVDLDTCRKISDILECFEIDLYKSDELMPQAEFDSR